MGAVSIRDLRNHGGEVVDRVERGESVVVTRNGKPVAELRPLRSAGLPLAELLRRRAHLAPVDPDLFRRDVDALARSVRLMGQGILDTSTLILLGRITDTEALPNEPMITAITLAELSVGPLVTNDPVERAARQAVLQGAESDFVPLPFDAVAARAFGAVAASLRAAGRKPAARAYDAMIAAIAIANGLPVHTCNPRDFQSIDGLDVIAVATPDPG